MIYPLCNPYIQVLLNFSYLSLYSMNAYTNIYTYIANYVYIYIYIYTSLFSLYSIYVNTSINTYIEAYQKFLCAMPHCQILLCLHYFDF